MHHLAFHHLLDQRYLDVPRHAKLRADMRIGHGIYSRPTSIAGENDGRGAYTSPHNFTIQLTYIRTYGLFAFIHIHSIKHNWENPSSNSRRQLDVSPVWIVFGYSVSCIVRQEIGLVSMSTSINVDVVRIELKFCIGHICIIDQSYVAMWVYSSFSSLNKWLLYTFLNIGHGLLFRPNLDCT